MKTPNWCSIVLSIILVFAYYNIATAADKETGKAKLPTEPSELGATCPKGFFKVRIDLSKRHIKAGEEVPLNITTYFSTSRAPQVDVSAAAGAGLFLESGHHFFRGRTDNTGELLVTWRSPPPVGSEHGSASYALNVYAFDVDNQNCSVKHVIHVTW